MTGVRVRVIKGIEGVKARGHMKVDRKHIQ
jgi:hypothetical protein